MKYKTEYDQLLSSGMFWEFYPELSGQWEADKKEFVKQVKKLRHGKH